MAHLHTPQGESQALLAHMQSALPAAYQVGTIWSLLLGILVAHSDARVLMHCLSLATCHSNTS